MTKDDIILVAKEAALPPAVYESASVLALCQAVARRSAEAEREACAKVADEISSKYAHGHYVINKYAYGHYGNEVDTANEIADAIRAKGST